MKPFESNQKHICSFGKTCKTLDNRYPPTKKFSRIKRKFSEFILISETNCRHCFAPMGTAGYIFEKERQLNRYSHMIHPYSRFRQFWEFFIILETLITILARLFVASQLDVAVFYTFRYQIFALLLDLFEMTDIALGFVTGYVDRETKDVILETHQVILQKFKSVKFYLSFISALPFEFSVYLLKSITLQFPIIRYIVFIKILRLPNAFVYMVHVAKIYNWSELVFRLVITFYNSLLIANWLSCLFFIVVFLDDFGPAENKFENDNPFVRHFIIFHMISCTLLFQSSLLSNLKIFSGKDLFFSSFLLLITSVLQAVALGFFVQLYCFKRTSFIHYQEMTQEAQKFIAQENLPKPIYDKIMDYFEFRFRGKYFREKSILETVSPPLRREIVTFLCRDLLTFPGSIFVNAPSELATELCLYMKYEIYLPGDDVIVEGKKATKIYFISCGSFSMYSTRGNEVQHLYNGDQFGEAAFASRNVNLGTVLALEMSECYTLKYIDFISCASDYPEYIITVKKVADAKMKIIKALIVT